ncbi:MAG: GNAT family N-acetyltransferase [Chloroflexi bacterium]|nr:GNAT family N-acetyltransferase [Chloroflexota bacterium]
MEVSAYRNASAFSELKSVWRELLPQAPMQRVFYTWEWQKTWWEAYEPGDLWILVCHDEGAPVGLAPLFVSEGETGRSVQIIGCVDVTDYLDFIVAEGRMDAVYTAFADYLSNHRAEFDHLDFCNIPFDSPTRRILPSLLADRGFETAVEQQEVCPVIELPASWSSYLSLLDKKQRHEVRRKMRRLQGSEQSTDWYIVNGGQDLTEEVSQFVRLMAASDPEKERFLQDAGNLRFFKTIVPLMQKRGWLQLTFLTIGDERAAAYMNFIYENRVMVYNSGHAHQDFGDFSPGIVLLAYNIRHAIEQGFTHYDFLRGDEAYKYRMGGRDTAVMNIRAS